MNKRIVLLILVLVMATSAVLLTGFTSAPDVPADTIILKPGTCPYAPPCNDDVLWPKPHPWPKPQPWPRPQPWPCRNCNPHPWIR